MKRRRGQEVTDLVDELDLQSNINSIMKDILVKNSFFNQDKKPVFQNMKNIEPKMNPKVTKLDFMSTQPILEEMPIV